MKRISIKMYAAMLLLLLAMVGITGTGMLTANEAVAAESEDATSSNFDQLAVSRASLSKTNRDSSRCVIPASGPWPACATGGGSSSGASSSGDCVIPASGPWPACATNGSGSGGSSGGASSSGDCVIPASGPWPACASGGGGGTSSGSGSAGGTTATPVDEAQPLGIRTGNLAYFAFDESGKTILDSNSGATGSISNGATRISGPRNNAVSMNGSGSVYIPDGPNVTVGSGDFTIALWVRLSKADGVQRILDKRTTGGALTGYHLFTADGKLGIQLADGQGNINSCNSDAGAARCTNYITKRFIADGQWHFIAITVDRNRERGLKFYVDNVLRSVQDPRDRQGSLDSSQNVPLVMDAAASAPLDVDELYIYGKVLSTDQIAYLHRNR